MVWGHGSATVRCPSPLKMVLWLVVAAGTAGGDGCGGDPRGEEVCAAARGGGGTQAMLEWGALEGVMGVSRILVINLSRRSGKWRDVKERLMGLGMGFERFEAVDGRELRRDKLVEILHEDAIRAIGMPVKTLQDFRNLRTLGSVGCFLSHLGVWQTAAEAAHDERVLVLEDDVVLAHSEGRKGAVDVLQNARNFFGVPTHWETGAWNDVDIVLLGFVDDANVARHPMGDRHVFECPSDPLLWRGHAYIVTARGSAILASEAMPLQYQVDYFMGNLVRQGILRCVAPMRQLVLEPTSHTGDSTDVQDLDVEPFAVPVN